MPPPSLPPPHAHTQQKAHTNTFVESVTHNLVMENADDDLHFYCEEDRWLSLRRLGLK